MFYAGKVFPQQVAPEVAVEVAPHRVHVIAVALRVVELDEERRALHTVVVRIAALEFAGPAKLCVETGLLRAAMRSAAMSGAITDTKASTMRINVSRCFGCSSVATMPLGESAFAVPSLCVWMSFGAVVLKTAFARCASLSDITSSRPGSSSYPRTRRPFFGPSITSAGFDPKKCGAVDTMLPFTIVKFSETW